MEGLRYLTVKSASLGGRGDISVWLPPNLDELAELPLVILLHGVYGSHWAWTMNGGAHRTASGLIEGCAIRPMALVMPSDGLWGDGTAYCRHRAHNYEKWIVDDVPLAARQLIPPSLRKYTPLFIGGLSMGGFGALNLGARNGREVFRAVSAHSSMTHFDQMELFVEEPLRVYGTLPKDRSARDSILLNRNRLPALRFDCGTSDPLIDCNRELHTELTNAGIPHTYEEFPGGHEWAYWETHLADSLKFFDRSL